MDNSQALTPLRKSDYEAIEAAVMETEKGRWFLAEYASRHRAADTDEVLGAIARLEGMLKRERRPDADRIRLDIGEMKSAIERTKLEIAQIKSDGHSPLNRFDRASNELDAIVEQTEAATSEILGAAEKVQEIAFTMREAGLPDQFCDDIENLTTTIYMACSFQDLTGQRTQKVVQVLRYLENRINAMIDIWGMDEEEVVSSSSKARAPINPQDRRPDAHLLNGPALSGEGIEQTVVDNLMVEDEEADEAALVSVANHAIDHMDFDRIDAMSALDTNPLAAPDLAVDADGQIDFDAIVVPKDADGQIDFDAIVVDGADEVAVSATPPAGAAAEEDDVLHFDPDGRSTVTEVDVDDVMAEVIDADTTPLAADLTVGAEAPVAEDEISEEELAIAHDAVDDAIGALKEVTEIARAKTAEGVDDPFEKMTKVERQALFS